jgi:exonuclease III
MEPSVGGGSERIKSKPKQKKKSNTNVNTVNNLSCLYTNVDCLTNKMDELNVYIKEKNYDIIGITEVKPKNHRYDLKIGEIQIEGYTMFTCNIENKNGRGICIYIKDNYNVQEYIPAEKCEEAIWIEIEANRKNKIIIGCIYRSPNSTQSNNDALIRQISEMCNLYNSQQTIIMGDFNYRNINWSNWSTKTDSINNDDFRFLEGLRDNYLFQNIEEPTRARGTNKPSLLDLILTNQEDLINNIEYHSPVGKSDHSTITFQIEEEVVVSKRMKTFYMYAYAKYEEMRKELESINWTEVLDKNSDVNEQWCEFTSIMAKLEEKYVPKKTVDVSRARKGDFPLPADIRKSVKRKHHLWKKIYGDKKWENIRGIL